jgi:hypothetical protein
MFEDSTEKEIVVESELKESFEQKTAEMTPQSQNKTPIRQRIRNYHASTQSQAIFRRNLLSYKAYAVPRIHINRNNFQLDKEYNSRVKKQQYEELVSRDLVFRVCKLLQLII